METELAGLKAWCQVSDVASTPRACCWRAEGVHYQDDVERQQAHIATLAKSATAIENLEVLRGRIRKPSGVSDARGSAVGVGGPVLRVGIARPVV